MRRRNQIKETVLVYIAAFMLFAVGITGLSATATDAAKYYGIKQSRLTYENQGEKGMIEASIEKALRKKETNVIYTDANLSADEVCKYLYETIARLPEGAMDYSPKFRIVMATDAPGKYIGYRLEYLSDKSGKTRENEIRTVSDDIVKEAKKRSEKEDQVIYVLNWFSNNCTYTDTPANMWDQNIYGCLVNGRSTCVGYAESFQYLMNRLDIPCEILVDTGEKRHAWNRVFVDGEAHEVDPTRK